MFDSFSIIFLLAAIISVVNHKYVKLSPTIGALLLSLIFTVFLIATQYFSPQFYKGICGVVKDTDFSKLLLDVMLSFLLFAGAIHIDIRKLLKEKRAILTLASIGLLISTSLFGFIFYHAAQSFGIDLPLMASMLLGAIISPTDPIAVLAILKKAGVSESLKLTIEGESLFNDGFGVVVFTIMLAMVEQNIQGPILHEVGIVFIHEVLGGLLFGLVLGYVTKRLLMMVYDNGKLSIMITLSTVMGGYAIAHSIGVSGLLTIVMFGLYLGYFINSKEYPVALKIKINELWSALDYSMNIILFVLIGISMHLVVYDIQVIIIAPLAILVMLLSRYVSVALSSILINPKSFHKKKTTLILTWGALRGGISLALVMSLPMSNYKSTLLTIVFVIVIFSIIVQGLSLESVVKKIGL